MLGEPALLARNHRGDPQPEALLAEQRVASIAGPVGPDLAGLGEMGDVPILGVARPRNVLNTLRQREADGVHARHEGTAVTERLEHRLPIRVMIPIDAAT